ncbi:DNA-directed RNA polymerase III 25 kD polypeptide [Histoplasma capsulatum]|uniref:DNA-directed RNA polymerase III 25 kD polypeptide n=1 Tax=Ajellomyces capsulatus TaxID=5037 RepID=A0A8A1MM24_AJECA|nr:DNA-directed RNA polymerase III 25 kD polypeptide [Histoplasma capsulatum]
MVLDSTSPTKSGFGITVRVQFSTLILAKRCAFELRRRSGMIRSQTRLMTRMGSMQIAGLGLVAWWS